MTNEIYLLGLNEVHTLENHYVMRVPGGWIYTDRRGESAVGTFVPYHDEFNEVDTF